MKLKTKQKFHRVTGFLKECLNDLTLYPELKEDLKLLGTPEIKENIRADLSYILPGLLILATSTEESLLHEIVPLYSVINDIVSKDISLKSESWWREMESKIVPNNFFSGLTTLIENNNEYWAQTWIFAMSLMVNDAQVQGSTVNSLLKIMEVAFKKSLTDSSGSVMEKAFFCWIRFIDICTNNPKIVQSKKLIGLLIRPLTIHMGPKAHFKMIETYKYLFEKVGKSEDKNIVLDIINPFIEYAYMKNELSFSRTHPNECCDLVIQLLSGKYTDKRISVTPVLTAFSNCVGSKPSEDSLVKVWTSILDCSDIIETHDYEQYLHEVMTQCRKIMRNKEVIKEYENLGYYLRKHELPTIAPEVLDKLLTSNALSPKVLADMMECNDFRTKTLCNYFNQFLKNVNFETDKREPSSNTGHMEAWDTFCAAFNLLIDSKRYNIQETDPDMFKALILFPLKTSAKWAGVTQRTWHSLLDSLDKIGILKLIVPEVIFTLNSNIDNNKVNTTSVIDIISHLINIDKTVTINSTVDKILTRLPKEDPKNAIDLLAFTENIIGHGDKKQFLSGVLSELLRICTCFDQLYEHRIKTKVSKLHRKLILDSKSDKNDKSKESKTPSPKIRSPLLTGSNFLHRLAKSEEKKAMSSISPPVLGDRTAKSSIKLTLDSDNFNDDEKLPLKEKDEEEMISTKQDISLPKSVNILVTNNIIKTNNLQSLNEIEDQIKANSKLQNGTCRFSTFRVKPNVINKKTAISYFEDDTQEFVVVPSKPKRNTPLTEHQKEKMLQRKSDIPALYQDLSQDTQSISNILAKSVPEILVSSDTDKAQTSNLLEKKNVKHSEKLDISKESIELIEGTPPCQDLLSTPKKRSPYVTANKKLNFEGLVKSNSPLCNEKQVNNNDKNESFHQNSNVSTSRRVSHRKTTSKYGAYRKITPTKDSDDSISGIDEIFPATDDILQTKSFIKQGIVVKNSKQDNEKTFDHRKEEEESFKKSERTTETEHSTENISPTVVKSIQQHVKERIEAVSLKPVLNFDEIKVDTILSKDDYKDGVEKEDQEAAPSKINDKLIDKAKTNTEKSGNEESIEKFNLEIEIIDLDESSQEKNEQHSNSEQPIESNKIDTFAEKVDGMEKNKFYGNSFTKSSIKNVTTVSEEKSPSQSKDCQDEEHLTTEKSENKIVNNLTPPPSQQKIRRPRKKPPCPFSPKLTRSKKLSLQNREKSPKSPKEPKIKIKAPKPNTECFSSDSNDSLSGIVSLENNNKKADVDTDEINIVEEHCIKSSNEAEHNLGKENKNVELNKVAGLNKSLPKDVENNEPLYEKQKLFECNENSQSNQKSRKRKLPLLPEENNEKIDSNSEIKQVIPAKKGRPKKGIGTTGLNSSSSKLSSGLEHWLYKKDKFTVKSPTKQLHNIKEKNTSLDLKDKSSENLVCISPVEGGSLGENNEKSFSKEIMSMDTSECSDDINNLQTSKEIRQSEDLDDTVIITSEESGDRECQMLRNSAGDELVESSQHSEDIFGLLTKGRLLPALVDEKIELSSSSNIEITKDLQSTSKESSDEFSPAVTKVEKITNGMKACDLIFKGTEIEKKITIYMEQRPFSTKNEVVSPLRVNKVERENSFIKSEDINSSKTRVICKTPLAGNEGKDVENCSPLDCKKSELTSNISKHSGHPTSVSTEKSTPSESDLVQMDTTSLIELVEKDIASISDNVQETLTTSKSNEKSASSVIRKENEILTIEVKDEITEDINRKTISAIDIDVSTKPEENEIATALPDITETERLLATSSDDIQSNSEHLFKTDTPKKRGARFIHTTEKEEDGGDSAEDRKKRSFRSRRINVEDMNTLGSSGRSKHMVQLAQQGHNSLINTRRRRQSVIPINYGANWPTGPTEDWVATRPTTPVPCSSPGILKPSPAPSTPINATVSPPPKKKRVNFLDPPVSTGLLYVKGNHIGMGQLHYADVSPGEKRAWNSDEDLSERLTKKDDTKDDHSHEELQPTVNIELLSSDESLEVISDNEITENQLPKDSNTNSIVDTVLSLEETVSIETPTKTVTTSSSTNVEIQPQQQNNEQLNNIVNMIKNQNENNIPTIEQLKIFFNNKQFIDNLALVINGSDEQISWCQQFFNSLHKTSKK